MKTSQYQSFFGCRLLIYYLSFPFHVAGRPVKLKGIYFNKTVQGRMCDPYVKKCFFKIFHNALAEIYNLPCADCQMY